MTAPTEWHLEAFGDPLRDVLIGVAGNGSRVMFWLGYGLVCPDLVTTNGDVYTLLGSRGRPVSLTPPGAAWFVGWALYTMARDR